MYNRVPTIEALLYTVYTLDNKFEIKATSVNVISKVYINFTLNKRVILCKLDQIAAHCLTVSYAVVTGVEPVYYGKKLVTRHAWCVI